MGKVPKIAKKILLCRVQYFFFGMLASQLGFIPSALHSIYFPHPNNQVSNVYRVIIDWCLFVSLQPLFTLSKYVNLSESLELPQAY